MLYSRQTRFIIQHKTENGWEDWDKFVPYDNAVEINAAWQKFTAPERTMIGSGFHTGRYRIITRTIEESFYQELK